VYISLRQTHLGITERRLPYEITLCHLTRDPVRQTGSRFIYPGVMEGCVDIGCCLYTEIIYLSRDSHPSIHLLTTL